MTGTQKLVAVALLAAGASALLNSDLTAPRWIERETLPEPVPLTIASSTAVPTQTAVAPRTWNVGEYQLTAVAAYGVTATVGRLERYRHATAADLLPLDAVLGWGRCDSAVLRGLKLRQRNRWYFWELPAASALAPAEVHQSTANVHLIPRDQAVWAQLKGLRRYERVKLAGYLVDIRRQDGWSMNTSRSRDDHGAGACEILWVDAVETINE